MCVCIHESVASCHVLFSYWQDCDPEEMEDTDEFKWAVKVVLKRQMRDLVSFKNGQPSF